MLCVGTAMLIIDEILQESYVVKSCLNRAQLIRSFNFSNILNEFDLDSGGGGIQQFYNFIRWKRMLRRSSKFLINSRMFGCKKKFEFPLFEASVI